MQLQIQHSKNFYLVLNTGLIPFSNRKYKGRKKLATKEKNEKNKKNKKKPDPLI